MLTHMVAKQMQIIALRFCSLGFFCFLLKSMGQVASCLSGTGHLAQGSGIIRQFSTCFFFAMGHIRKPNLARKAALLEGLAPKACKPFALFVKQHCRIKKGSSRAESAADMKRLGAQWRKLSEHEKRRYKEQSCLQYHHQRQALVTCGVPLKKKAAKLQQQSEEGSEYKGSACKGSKHQGSGLNGSGLNGSGPKARLPHAEPVPDTFGSFRVDQASTGLLGQGGFGMVRKCFDNVGRMFVVKVFQCKNAMECVDIETTAFQTLEAGLQPHELQWFPKVYHHCSCVGFSYIVFEYGGESLAQVLKSCAGEALLVKRVALQLWSALNAVHKAGLLHLDVKPGNVLWREDSCKLMLCDFGLSEPGPGQLRPAPRMVQYVTELFRPPELLEADETWPVDLLQQALTPAVDLWSYGCTVFEVATGRALMKPFSEQGPKQVIKVWRELFSPVPPDCQDSVLHWRLSKRLEGAGEWMNLVKAACHPCAKRREWPDSNSFSW